MYIRNDKIIIRKTVIRVNQFCALCGREIPKYTKVILVSNIKGRDRKYYHTECMEEELNSLENKPKNA